MAPSSSIPPIESLYGFVLGRTIVSATATVAFAARIASRSVQSPPVHAPGAWSTRLLTVYVAADAAGVSARHDHGGD